METKRSYVATVQESYFEETYSGGWVRSAPITIGVFDSLSKSEAEAIESQLNGADIPRGPDCQFDIDFAEMSGFEFELTKQEFETSQTNSANSDPSVANLIRLCSQAASLAIEKSADKPKFNYATNHPKLDHRNLALELNKALADPKNKRSQNDIAADFFNPEKRSVVLKALSTIRKYELDKRKAASATK